MRKPNLAKSLANAAASSGEPNKAVLLVCLLWLPILSACHFERVERSKSQEFRFDLSGRAPALEVRIDDGSVEIERTNGDELLVVFRIVARAATDESAEALLGNMTVSARAEGLPAEALPSERSPSGASAGELIRIEARRNLPSVRFSPTSLRADVTIRLPHEAEIDIFTEDGNIELEGISGKVEAETGDGRIRLRDFTGRARLTSGDGSITGTNLKGEIEAHSDDGSIQLEGAFGRLYAVTSDGSLRVTCNEYLPLTGGWTLRSSDGSIGLSLAAGFSADLEASTNDGRIVNELSGFEGNERDQRLLGRVGDGGELILLKTLDGRITLRDL